MRISWGIVYLCFICTLQYSCDNSSDIVPKVNNQDVHFSEDDVFADDVFEKMDGTIEDDLEALTEVSFMPELLKTANQVICKNITIEEPVDNSRFPKIITIDYGEGCTVGNNNDTIVRKGKIIVELTKRMFQPGSKRIITFHNYVVNGVQIEGIRTITNEGVKTTGNIQYTIKLDKGKLIFPDGTTYTRTSHKVRTWTRGSTPEEDIVEVTGSCYGKNFNRVAYNRTITDTITIKRCPNYDLRWEIVKGTVTSTIEEKSFVLDYGMGECDRLVTVTRSGETKEIELSKIIRK